MPFYHNIPESHSKIHHDHNFASWSNSIQYRLQHGFSITFDRRSDLAKLNCFQWLFDNQVKSNWCRMPWCRNWTLSVAFNLNFIWRFCSVTPNSNIFIVINENQLPDNSIRQWTGFPWVICNSNRPSVIHLRNPVLHCFVAHRVNASPWNILIWMAIALHHRSFKLL